MRKMTGYFADACGFVTIVRMRAPRLVFDLPAGGKRLLQPSTGYLHSLVSGVEVCRNGESTGETPGRLVRGAQPNP